jgi:methionyl-tRNA synthetase
MSKSLGNVVKPLDLADQYGADSLRYYLMRNMVLGQDASFTLDSFIKRYNADLANDYGNLVNRVLILIYKNFDQKIPEPGEFDTIDLNLITKAKQIPNQVIICYNSLKIHDAIELVMGLFRSVNKYLELKSPWKEIKNDSNNGSIAATTLYISAEILKIGSILLSPIIPKKSDQVLEYLSIKSKKDFSFGNLEPGTSILLPKNLFQRIDNK